MAMSAETDDPFADPVTGDEDILLSSSMGEAQDPITALFTSLLFRRPERRFQGRWIPMILQRIDSRREEGSGVLIDLYELREGPDGIPVHDLERMEQILDSAPFQNAMEQLGKTAHATITGPAGAGVLEIRVHFDHHREECDRIEL